jgi:hypothetical protein
VEQILNGFHAPISVRLFLDDDGRGLQEPRPLIQVADHALKHTIRVERRDA